MTERLRAIKGSMFSGKTDELISQIEKQLYARKRIQVFKPSIDVRYNPNKLVSHNGKEFEAMRVEDSNELLANISRRTQFVAIDEVQFFDEGILRVVEELQEKNVEVMVAGLPLDFRGEPFGSMPELLARADFIIEKHAICDQRMFLFWTCGRTATRTQRYLNGKPANYTDPVIIVGEKELYAARCVRHHVVPGRPIGGNG